ncbi:hypothetical protein ACO0QE_003663 [Hanseniaspora vineae]
MSDVEDHQPETVEDEYELWKSNVPLMYEFLSETKMLWPTLTTEWLPSAADSLRQELIIGTHTSGEEPNYLKIAAIELPIDVLSVKQSVSDKDQPHASKPKLKIARKFEHELEVNRARYMPQDSNFVATINGKGKVFLYNRSVKDKKNALVSEFEIHKDNGYGLSFNPNTKGQLLSSSDDFTIALWNVESSLIHLYKCHSDIVNDSKWHNFYSYYFASVSEDKTFKFHDTRTSAVVNTIKTGVPFNTLAFSKHSKNLVAAAGNDTLVYLYDTRNTAKPLHVMSGHADSVTSLDFASHKDGILCSSGEDRRVITWDICNFGAEQSPDDAEDGSPELLMMHGGHKSNVSDFSINPNIPWLMASAEEENVLQIWKPSGKLTHPSAYTSFGISDLE